MIGIYKITNQVNNKVYIGQSVNIGARWTAEKSNAFNVNSNVYDTPLSRAFRKYGLNNFSFTILEECSKDKLNERETYYIYLYHSLVPYGYNVANGGTAPSHAVKLQYDIVEQIIQDLKNNQLTQLEIATKYNVSKDTITDINLGHSWHSPLFDYPIRKNFLNKEIKYCECCGIQISSEAHYCRACSSKMRRTIERPDKDTLLKEIATSSFVQVGAKYNVSDKAIVKWCKAYGLPTHKKDLVELYNKMHL